MDTISKPRSFVDPKGKKIKISRSGVFLDDKFYCEPTVVIKRADNTVLKFLKKFINMLKFLFPPSVMFNYHKSAPIRYQKFIVTTSFVATRSGLLRWIDHIKKPDDSPEP
uniref:Uncharacterized protein n=1 Tax=Glossina pallidipes TaxID=7398 RepID=A0A1A9ZTG8_GLOPL